MDRDTMKRVFIIRNNMANRKIYSNANDSFENKEKGKYFVSGKNKESLNRMAKKVNAPYPVPFLSFEKLR